MKYKFTDRIKPFHIFAMIVILGFAGYLFYAYRYGSVITDFFMMENTDLNFCDLWMHVYFVSDPSQLYNVGTPQAGCFPPLSYLMYYAIWMIIRRDGYAPAAFEEMDRIPYADLIMVYYSIFVVFCLFIGILLWHNDLFRTSVIVGVLLISVPFVSGGMAVANSTLLVMSWLLIALKLRDSNSSAVREAALLIIAICAGFKIYPAVFGLLYLLERRYKEAIRLTVYGIFFFFVPFAFFGGTDCFIRWFQNVRYTMGLIGFGRVQSLKEMIYTVVTLCNGHLPDAVYSMIPIAFLAIMIVLACLTRSRSRRLFFLCAIMTFFPTNAYRYTLCYMSIPLVVYARYDDSEENKSVMDKAFEYAEMIVLGLVYAMPVIPGKILGFKLTYEIYTATYAEIWIYIFAYLLLITVVCHEVCVLLKNRSKVSHAKTAWV
ncbi:MAG: DUF2029 domain-containing protein [Lachnospiraceae bacterium]|nr:DUF2029 domain-containing protein [Lachnospiraceae bacterium]